MKGLTGKGETGYPGPPGRPGPKGPPGSRGQLDTNHNIFKVAARRVLIRGTREGGRGINTRKGNFSAFLGINGYHTSTYKAHPVC